MSIATKDDVSVDKTSSEGHLASSGHNRNELKPFNEYMTKAREDELNAGNEISRMKELLLSHLDYIQQQTEFIYAKDKAIDDLKHENEMLKQKIHRMGRRVSLTKPKDAEDRSSRKSSPVRRSSNHRKHSAPSSHCTVGREKKSLRQNSVDTKDTRLRKKTIKDESKDKDKKKRKKFLVESNNTTCNSLSPVLRAKGDASIGPLLSRFDRLTLTSSAYFTAVAEWNDTISPPATIPKSSLEVPKWTIKSYTSSYTLEGTENLSDDVFDRRHFRLAIDEKRRKRWDVQRIREQRQIERLKQREEQKKAKREALNNPIPIRSFWPDPEEITDRLQLVVMDKIPIAVFGISIPQTPESEPVLWWQNGKVQVCTKSRKRKSFN